MVGFGKAARADDLRRVIETRGGRGRGKPQLQPLLLAFIILHPPVLLSATVAFRVLSATVAFRVSSSTNICLLLRTTIRVESRERLPVLLVPVER